MTNQNAASSAMTRESAHTLTRLLRALPLSLLCVSFFWCSQTSAESSPNLLPMRPDPVFITATATTSPVGATRRAIFFAWCTGTPVAFPTPSLAALRSIDKGCADFADARARAYKALLDAVQANLNRNMGLVYGRLMVEFEFAVCRETVERRTGKTPEIIRCSTRERRMVDSPLDLPGVYDFYRDSFPWASNPAQTSEPWNEEVKTRILNLLSGMSPPRDLRRYFERIGGSCEHVRSKELEFECRLGQIEFIEVTSPRKKTFWLGVEWIINFEQSPDGAISDVRVWAGITAL